jgi:hypothetical protein
MKNKSEPVEEEKKENKEEEKKEEEPKKNHFDSLKNAHRTSDINRVIELSADQVQRGKSRYGSK